MPKKPPARGKLLKRKLKPQKTVKAKARRKTAKAKARQKAARPAVARPRDEETAERLQEAMEELQEARTELSRLGHAVTASHRELEDQKLSATSAQSNLRAELAAVRTDLKTALAELEIARADRERIATMAQRRIHDLEEALARVRAEVAELRPPLPPPPTTKPGGSGQEETP
jgi:chromosome segregation ATPase